MRLKLYKLRLFCCDLVIFLWPYHKINNGWLYVDFKMLFLFSSQGSGAPFWRVRNKIINEECPGSLFLGSRAYLRQSPKIRDWPEDK